ncbi:MAG: homoserine kinase [Aquaspirillum sp.]
MSVYTTVTPEALVAWLSRYSLGALIDLKGIAAGVTNTNYFVTTEQGRYVLTLFEVLQLDELPYYLDLMKHLAEHGVAVAAPIADQEGQLASLLCDKPACLVACLAGRDLTTPNASHCAQVATTMAKMHVSGQTFTGHMSNPRGLDWWQRTAARVYPFMPADEVALLQRELALQQQQSFADLPRGVVHADLFRDNVLFDGDHISGFIDFYYACDDAWLYDLAIAVNDWCSLPDGDIDAERARAMLTAYQTVRPLQAAEVAAWPLMLRAAAIRFWTSRLLDFHCPQAGELTFAKDPGHFQRILQQHCHRQDFWLN